MKLMIELLRIDLWSDLSCILHDMVVPTCSTIESVKQIIKERNDNDGGQVCK